MVEWERQGGAYVGAVSLRDGRWGKVVLVGARENPKGAMLVLSGDEGPEPVPVPLSGHLTDLSPACVMEVLCMQERAFGGSGLPPLES